MTTEHVLAILNQDSDHYTWLASDFLTDRDIADKAGYFAECLAGHWSDEYPADDTAAVDWLFIATLYLQKAAAAL